MSGLSGAMCSVRGLRKRAHCRFVWLRQNVNPRRVNGCRNAAPSHLLGPRCCPESGWTRFSAGVHEVERAHEGSVHVDGAGIRWHNRGYSQGRETRYSVVKLRVASRGGRSLPGCPSRSARRLTGTSAAGVPRASARNLVPTVWPGACRCVEDCAVGAHGRWHPSDVGYLACVVGCAGAQGVAR